MDEYYETLKESHVAALREYTTWIESLEHEQLIEEVCRYGVRYVGLWPYNRDRFSEYVGAIGKCEKGSNSTSVFVKKAFGSSSSTNIELTVRLSHEEICEKVVVGVRQVEKQVPVGEVQYTTEIVEEEIVEWKCPESFLKKA